MGETPRHNTRVAEDDMAWTREMRRGRLIVQVGDMFLTQLQETGRAWVYPLAIGDEGPLDLGDAVDAIRAACAPLGLEDVLITPARLDQLKVEVRDA